MAIAIAAAIDITLAATNATVAIAATVTTAFVVAAITTIAVAVDGNSTTQNAKQ